MIFLWRVRNDVHVIFAQTLLEICCSYGIPHTWEQEHGKSREMKLLHNKKRKMKRKKETMKAINKRHL